MRVDERSTMGFALYLTPGNPSPQLVSNLPGAERHTSCISKEYFALTWQFAPQSSTPTIFSLPAMTIHCKPIFY